MQITKKKILAAAVGLALAVGFSAPSAQAHGYRYYSHGCPTCVYKKYHNYYRYYGCRTCGYYRHYYRNCCSYNYCNGCSYGYSCNGCGYSYYYGGYYY